MTRDVRDAARLLGVMAGHDPRDSTSLPAPAEDYEAGTGKGGRAHPGYVAMMKWQVEQKVCFPINQTRNGVRELRDAYFAATGVHVPLDSDPEAA